MNSYLVSLAAGVLVGLIYGVIHVRSPAPPVIALAGLLGILIGEQIPSLGRAIWLREPVARAWLDQVRPHMFGPLPQGDSPHVNSMEKSAAEPPS